MIRSRVATMSALFIVMSAGTGEAVEVRPSWLSVNGLLAARYEAMWNVNPALDGAEDDNESQLLGYLIATLSVRPVDSIEGVLTLASREVSRQTLDDGTVEDRWSTTRFIDEAWLKVTRGTSWIKAGKQRLVIGRGLVLDSYQPAVSGNVSVRSTGPRVDIKAFGAGLDEDGVLREDQSLYAGGRLDVSFPLAGRISASVSHLRDRNAMIPTLLPITIQTALDTLGFQPDGGDLTYWIVDGATRHGDWSLDAVAVLQTGTLTGTVASAPLSVTLLGKAAKATIGYRVRQGLNAGVWGLYTSGDARGATSTLGNQRYEGFVPIYPLVDATNLFFNGGIDSAFTSGSSTASGVLGRGVLAGALTADIASDRGILRLTVADLWSEFPLAEGLGRHYGWEIDTEWAYAVTDRLTARLEGDVLLPGSFYTDLDPDPEPVYKLAVGVDLAW
jgi:hypothetical protein